MSNWKYFFIWAIKPNIFQIIAYMNKITLVEDCKTSILSIPRHGTREQSILTSLFGVLGERSSLNHTDIMLLETVKGLLTNGLTVPSARAIRADLAHPPPFHPCKYFSQASAQEKCLLINLVGIMDPTTGSPETSWPICHLPLARGQRVQGNVWCVSQPRSCFSEPLAPLLLGALLACCLFCSSTFMSISNHFKLRSKWR